MLRPCEDLSDNIDPLAEETTCSDFELLLQGVRRAHRLEVQRLRAELETLRLKVPDHPSTQSNAEFGPQDWGPRSPVADVLNPPAPSCKDDVEEQVGEAPAGTPPAAPSNGVKCEGVHVEGLKGDATVESSQVDEAPMETHMSKTMTQTATNRTKSRKPTWSMIIARHRGLSRAHHDGGNLDVRWVTRLVTSPKFEFVFATLILLNGVVMAVEAQYTGFDLAIEIGHRSARNSSQVTWPHAKTFFDVVGWTFGACFCVELCLKIIGLRGAFLKDCWNYVDFIVASVWVVNSVVGLFVPINSFVIRLARLGRLVRLWRLIKAMRTQSFDSLYLMTTALKGSAPILAWAIILMLVVHMLLALLFNQILRETFFNHPEMWTDADAPRVFEYFGSFSRSFLTMFEITLANWPVACRVLTENLSEWFVLYTFMHKMALGFACIGVVNAVFIQETFKVASLDDVVMVRQHMRKLKSHDNNMRRLFEEADSNHDDQVDLEEWKQVCEDDWVKVWLASQDLNAQDAVTLFKMLSDGKGVATLTAEDLINGASRLKGQASSMDMRIILNQVAKELQKMDKRLEAFTRQADPFADIGVGSQPIDMWPSSKSDDGK